MSDHDRLTEALRQRADRLDAELGTAHPISLDDVRGRARGIRRRRAAASGLAAAAVLAVAVPVGLSVTDRTVGDVDRGPAATATADPTATPSTDATGSPLPDATPKVLLTVDADATSGAPGISYIRDGVLITPDGREVSLDREYGAVAASGDGWVALDMNAGRMVVLDAEGNETWGGPGTWPLAVSADGSVVAVGSEDGAIRTVADGEEPQLIRAGRGPARVAGVIGSGTCDETEGDGTGCTVFYNVDGQTLSGGRYVTSHGIDDTLPVLKSVEAVSPDGLVAGFTSVDDYGSCSAVIDDRGSQVWDTCDHSLGRFSPDGRYVIGHPAYRDGIGDGSVAILDASSGEVLVEYQNDAETQSFINDVVWDTDGTLLATVHERGTWSVMRMTADGQLSEVLGEIGTDEMEVPVRFAARP